MSVTTQTAALATLPTGTKLALDVVGAAAAPAAGDGLAYTKIDVGAAGLSSPVTAANPLPVGVVGTVAVSGPLTDAQLRATPVPVSGTVSTGGLTDTQLRASAVPVSGPLTDVQLRASAVPVSGPLTDTQLRATPVPISGSVTATGPLTDTQLRASAVPVSGPATDAQLRATPLPISGTVTVTDGSGPLSIDDNAGSLTVDAPVGTPVFVRLSDGAAAITTLPVSGPLTDTQLRATAVPVSGTVSAKIQDSAGTAITQKAASTAAAAADPSLVVALSPNSPLPSGTNLIGLAAVPPATLVVTAVSAANTGVTCTLPAVAGQFHYISRIVIERVATAAIVGSAVLTYTSTNLPGSWARTAGNAAPVGVQQMDVDESLGTELKSSAVNTNTTIIAPAAGATGVIRITVYYRAAA